MKNSITVKVFSIIFIIVSIAGVIGCKNFLGGEELLDELELCINELNAPEVSFLISVDADTGTSNPVGEVKYKVGKTFSIEFNESKAYQFLKWEVLDRSTKRPIADYNKYIKIDDEKQSKINVTVIEKADNILIHPVCAERPDIRMFNPQYKVIGEPKDSSIILTFTTNISNTKGIGKDSEGNDVEEPITVIFENEDLILGEYFSAPSVSDNIITIPANPNNLLSFSEKTKSITVKVPSSIYYELDDGTKVTMGYDYTYTYLVNNTTNDQAEITFSVLPEKGSISPNDTLKMNIGESKNITFIPNSDYDFQGWSITDSENKDIPKTVIDIENENELTTTITVLQKVLGAKITPISKKILKPQVVTPVYSIAGINYDTQILINFNKSVDSSYITRDNIHLYNINNKEITEYFKNPEPLLISSESKLCNSFKMDFDYSKMNDFNKLLEDYSGLMEVKIVLNKAITDGEGIPLSEDYEYTYIINSSTEKFRPVINTLTLSKNETFEKTLVTSNYKNWKEQDYKDNHTNSFYFKCDASDVGSGVKTVTIKETVLFDVDNNPVNSSTTKTFDYKKDETQKYNFQSKIDGLIQLDFTVSDFMGNKSDNTMTYYVVKDTVFSVPVFIFTEAGDIYDQLKKDSTINDINVIRNGYYSIYFYYDSSESNVFKYGFDKWYNEYETNPEDYIYSITWGPEDNKSKYTAGNKEIHRIIYDTKKEAFYDDKIKKSHPNYSSSEQTQTYFGFTFPKDKIDVAKDTYYTLYIKDEAGNEFTLPNNVLLKQDKIISGEINPSANTDINYYLSPDSTNYTIYYEEKNKTTGEVKLYRKTGSEFSDKLYSLDTENCEYTLYSVKHNKLGDNRYTSGLLSEGWVVSPSALEDGTDETLKNPDFDLNITNAGNENYKITITMDSETYSKYDSVQVYYGYTQYGSSKTTQLGVFDNSNVYELIIPYTKLLPKEGVTSPYYKTSGKCQMEKFGIRCIKDNKVYTSEKNTPDASTFVVDNVPPKITERYIYTASTKYVVYCSSLTDAFYTENGKGYDVPYTGIEKNANGKCRATSYWINNINYGEFVDGYNGDKDSLAALEIDKSTILSAPKSEFEFSEGESSIFIPRPENTTVGSYLICIQIEDEAGNEYIGPIGFINLTLLNVKPTVEFESENNRNVGKYILQNGPKVQGGTKYTISKTIQYFDTTDNTWKYFTKNNGKYRTYIPSKSTQENGDDKGFEYMLWVGKTDAGANIEPGNENLFIRVEAAERLSANKQSALENLLNEGFQVAKPVYFYLSDTLCSSGYLVKSGKDYVANCEQPCLVSTVYSKENFGDDVDAWEVNCVENQYKNTQQLIRYQRYTPDVESVPSNSYYCVIAHFADGSSEISEVFYKQ